MSLKLIVVYTYVIEGKRERTVELIKKRIDLMIGHNSPLHQIIHYMLWDFHKFVVITFLTTTENITLRDHDIKMLENFA